jgi:hypothetical protein
MLIGGLFPHSCMKYENGPAVGISNSRAIHYIHGTMVSLVLSSIMAESESLYS